MHEAAKVQDLPPDNASRLAIYDAIYQHAEEAGTPEITEEELFERVIGRLRVLVPRELHLAGDRAYVDEKVDACVQAGIIVASSGNGRRLLALTGQPPLIRYPDGEVHAYTAGLELARERLDRDNTRLRAAGFDVREFIPSISADPDGGPFQTLLASMREHGFMKQFPIVKYEDGEFVDGRARHLAAAILDLKVEYYKPSDKARKALVRRDTPLNRVLVAIDSNVGRLPSDVVDAVVDAVHKAVADVTERAWEKTAADLELTQEWRKAMAAEYTPFFDVTKLAYRKGDAPTIQVTAEHKVMVRSLVEAGGLQGYKVTTQLGKYVPLELARTPYSGGPKAYLARAEDLIAGIEAMQQEQQAKNRELDPRWEQIYDWLVRTFAPTRG